MPANPVPVPASRTQEPLSSSSEKWQAYVKGGAVADDAQYMQKARKERTKFSEAVCSTPPPVGSSMSAKLVQISPEQAVSKKANLLIDLDLDLGQARAPTYGQQSYTSASAAKGKGRAVAKPNMNLLD
jgi:hypothetical protein